MPFPTLIIDFDSTLVTVESLDELARIALSGRADAQQVMDQLSELTTLGMEGKIGFEESLKRRLRLFQAHQTHVNQLVLQLQTCISPSVKRHKRWIQNHAEHIYIISGGFTDYIWPIVKEFYIAEDHVLANRFVFNKQGEITGHDTRCLLAHDDGKVKQIAILKLPRPIYIIGDGYTDYRPRELGAADIFFAYTENVQREKISQLADTSVDSFSELLKHIG